MTGTRLARDRNALARDRNALARDSRALAADLRARVRGEVRFDEGSRALYATDASNYRQMPIGVVVPLDRDDVVATVEICRRHRAPVLGRGGGTSLAGQCCNTAVVLDFSKYMNRVLEVDPERRTARVEPGAVLDRLREAAAEHGLTFGPDPATHRWCTLGGMIGNNSCGVHSVTAGRTSDNVERLTVLLYDGTVMRVGAMDDEEIERRVGDGDAGASREGASRGGAGTSREGENASREQEIYRSLVALRDRYAGLIRERYPPIPRRVSGYNLDELLPERGFHVARSLVGTEGTCAIVLEAELRLVPAPAARALLVLGYEDVYQAADHVPEVLAREPIGLEGMDERLVRYMRRKGLHVEHLGALPEGRGWLLVEFGGASEDEARERAERAYDALARRANGSAPTGRVITDPAEAELVWTIRESGLGATAFVPGMSSTWEGWEDAAVDPARLGDYLREFRALLDRYDYHGALYGHFGDGCVHTRIDFDLTTAPGIAKYRRFIDEAADLVLRYGGSLSGEHGDGQARAALLPKMFGPELVEAFRAFRRIWDPDGLMNPGKVVDAYEPDENLRLGTDYRPAPVKTHFRFPEDGGEFARAALRCVGVGKCRRTEAGTMCPSYRVTREEKHTTRGRAHLLFEMLRGDGLDGGWKSEHVKDALDLCLACKGCKGECPVHVDMATYKAEFLSHYYERRLRPPAAYAMGLIHRWARLASVAPRAVNAAMHAPGLSSLLKRLGGIAPEREMPRFAERTFRQRVEGLAARGRAPGSDAPRGRVLLWTDTFTNHFEPNIAMAALDVLEALGFEVDLPPDGLCCGRPLYDWGMLERAKRQLAEILDALRPELARGTPVVVLEPSCASVFRDELPNLFAGDPDAARLAGQVHTLGELLADEEDLDLPALDRAVLLHGHCHDKSVLRYGRTRHVVRQIARTLHEPDTSCCGMAGSFGFERDHYQVSQACGELALLPAVRALDQDALVVTDGFSCREQVAQNTGRRPLHLAEALRMALEGAGGLRAERSDGAAADDAADDVADQTDCADHADRGDRARQADHTDQPDAAADGGRRGGGPSNGRPRADETPGVSPRLRWLVVGAAAGVAASLAAAGAKGLLGQGPGRGAATGLRGQGGLGRRRAGRSGRLRRADGLLGGWTRRR